MKYINNPQYLTLAFGVLAGLLRSVVLGGGLLSGDLCLLPGSGSRLGLGRLAFLGGGHRGRDDRFVVLGLDALRLDLLVLALVLDNGVGGLDEPLVTLLAVVELAWGVTSLKKGNGTYAAPLVTIPRDSATFSKSGCGALARWISSMKETLWETYAAVAGVLDAGHQKLDLLRVVNLRHGEGSC